MTEGGREQDEGAAEAGEDTASRKRRWGWILTGAAAVLLAAATGFAGGFGSKMADLVGSDDPPLVSYSTSELSSGCAGGTFLPRQEAREVLGHAPPQDWSTLEARPGAAFVGRGLAEVSIQGESKRKITLTGIDIAVSRRPRPPGAVFTEPCGGPIVGRAIEVDLGTDPPRVTESSADPDGMLGSTVNGRRLTRPIRFPWTVSLTDPLLLDIVAAANSCYCVWSAEIPWVSGSHRGVISIDNEGDGYRVISDGGLPSFGVNFYSKRWRRSPSDL